MALRSVRSALIGAALLSGSAARATDLPAACPPAAHLEGERALVASIRASLLARGVAEGGALACQRLQVRVMPGSPGYDLFLTDAEGRTDRRQIARAETAAMVIESWLQADLGDPLLDRPAPAGPLAMAGAGSAASPPAMVAVSSPPPASPVRALGSLRGESAIDRGQAVWWGVGAGACFRAGPMCAGPEARLRASQGPPGLMVSSGPVAEGRSLEDLRSIEGGLKLEAPLALGPLRVLPGLFVGAGRLSGRWHNELLPEARRDRRDRDDDRPRRGRDDDGRRQDDQEASPDQTFARIGLRLGAGVGLALPLSGGVSVELQLSAGVRPVAPGGGAGAGSATPGLVGHAGAGLGLRYGAL